MASIPSTPITNQGPGPIHGGQPSAEIENKEGTDSTEQVTPATQPEE